MRLLQLDGLQLKVMVEPGAREQPPLLLINGLGANLELFDPFVEALREASRRRIGTIRFDLPGVGGSPARPHPLRARGLARLIARMLARLGVPRVDVLGISWGGGIAQQLARQYPALCRRLVLVSTSTGLVSIPGRVPVLRKLMSPWRYLRASRRHELDPQLYGQEVLRDRSGAARIAALMRPPTLLGYYLQLFAVAGWSSFFWLHLLEQPTLIISGNDDPIVPLSNARLMARRLPGAQLHVVDGGHLCLITQARTLAPVVHRFLTDGGQMSNGSDLARSRRASFWTFPVALFGRGPRTTLLGTL
jgi:poly(3-hydroxyalkanoate) depolymerase